MHTRRCTVDGAGVSGGDIGGLPPVDEPIVERGTIDVDQIGTLDVGASERPDQLRRKQQPAGGVGGGQILQIDSRTTVAAAHPGLAAIGTADRAPKLHRRTQQVAHRLRHLRPGTGDQFGDEFSRQLVRVGHRKIARVGHDGLAGGVDEIQRAALVGRLKLLPIQEYPVG